MKTPKIRVTKVKNERVAIRIGMEAVVLLESQRHRGGWRKKKVPEDQRVVMLVLEQTQCWF